MMTKRRFAWLMVPLMVALLAGCGSNRDSDGITATTTDLGSDPTTGVAFVGATTCISCHEDISFSADIVGGYLAGKHVENHAGTHPYEEMVEDGCIECHDPIGDSPEMADIVGHDVITVGCENCHGAGGEHYGTGPIPNAAPGPEACGQCHETIPESHLTYHPEAQNIYTNYTASRHATASVRNQAKCAKCHTDEGGKKYKDVTTKTQLEALVLPVESDAPVQCRTCHDPHQAGGLLQGEVEDHGHVVASAEYATCVTCHMSDSDDPSDVEWMYHDDVYYRIITDTHYDDPATTDVIEGYVVNKLGERSCRDCHNVHTVMEIRADEDSSSFSNTINDQWSKSGHGGHIGSIKLAVAEDEDDAGRNRTIDQTLAIKSSGVREADAAAWVHYDWDAGNRQSCQMCHTSTGVKNFLNDPVNYNPANNDFSHLEGWEMDEATGAVTSSGQNEMLYCWGCHSDNAGGLRDPGAITLAYTVDGVEPTLPDLGNSNVCVNCHGGRGNMDSLIGAATADPAGAAVTGGTKTHYLAAAGTIFKDETRIGYEYAGLEYADKVYYAHNTLGCADCHMQTEESHTWEVVEKDATDTIVALNSTKCVECHDGEHALFVSGDQVGETLDIWNGVDQAVPTVVTQTMADDAAAELEHEAHGYHEALDALAAALTAAGTTPTSSYPYFGGAATDQGHGGAMHNYSYLHHEPGAYAHNRYYAKRLIFDSIDWLTNATGAVDLAGSRSLDGTITLDPVADAAAIEWLGGDVATGVIATRP